MQPQQTTAEPAALSRGGLRRVLTVLCVTEITSWGVLYYAFPVLAPGIAADTGWSIGTITAAFSLGLVVSALVGIPAGRWLDRLGPRLIMTGGSVLAAPAVLGIATAPSLPWFFAAWALAGVAMACVLYQPAFAALTRWWGPRRVTALTTVALSGGLASRVFAPLTAALAEHLAWRHTYLVLAAVLAAVTIPAHLFGLRGRWPRADPVEHHRHVHGAPGLIARSRAFVLLAVLPGPAALLIAAAMLVGAARGVFTLLQATAISDRWGAAHYGRLNGILTAPAMVATALAPWAGAALSGVLGGYPTLFWLLSGIAVLAAALAAGSVPPAVPPEQTLAAQHGGASGGGGSGAA